MPTNSKTLLSQITTTPLAAPLAFTAPQPKNSPTPRLCTNPQGYVLNFSLLKIHQIHSLRHDQGLDYLPFIYVISSSNIPR